MAQLKPGVEPPAIPEPARNVPNLSGRSRQNLQNIRLIVLKEFKYRIFRRKFVTSTLTLTIMVFVTFTVPTLIQFINSRSDTQANLVVVNRAGKVGGLEIENYFAQ